MPTKEELNKIDELAVMRRLQEVIVATRDKYLLIWSVIVLYELEIILVSKDLGGELALDKYGYERYDKEWMRLVKVSNTFRHNTYSTQLMVSVLSEYINSPIVYTVLSSRGFTDELISAYIENLGWLLEELKNE